MNDLYIILTSRAASCWHIVLLLLIQLHPLDGWLRFEVICAYVSWMIVGIKFSD